MSTDSCGCSPGSCGCCEGTQAITPVSTFNRPGAPALRYRVGTHGAFLETMKARLSSMTVQALGADGETVETLRPLADLTTRESTDPAIAVLDAWATIGDVLTFYQERIANEGYLRTATERESVLELGRLVGYELRPGVAATVYLAYTLDDQQEQPVTIPAGSLSQSVPGPGELPQSFETSDDLEARRDWNNLTVRKTAPQVITWDNVLTIESIVFQGTSTGLGTGDWLLFDFGEDAEKNPLFAMRQVVTVTADYTNSRTTVTLQPLPASAIAYEPTWAAFKGAFGDIQKKGNATDQFVFLVMNGLGEQIRLGMSIDPAKVIADVFEGRVKPTVPPGSTPPQLSDEFAGLLKDFGGKLPKDADGSTTPVVTSPSQFVNGLLTPTKLQARNPASLTRELATSLGEGTDVQPQLLTRFAPRLKDTLYPAWRKAQVSPAASTLQGIFAFRVTAPLFGASVPKMAEYKPNGQLKTPAEWSEWDLDGDESTGAVFLDQAYEDILSGGYAVVQTTLGPFVLRRVFDVDSVETVQRTAYGISGKTTLLGFSKDWRVELPKSTTPTFDAVVVDNSTKLAVLRSVLVRTQTEKLTLAENTVADEVSGTWVVLDTVVDGLTSGRWVILTGERTDIEGVTGVIGTELLMVAAVSQGFDDTTPGDPTRTTLTFATELAYRYKRDTVALYANVVKATHGETRNERLGGGDGTAELQSFTLKQPPLTFVPAVTPEGVASTLHVYVDGVEWHEKKTFVDQDPADRIFVTRTEDDGKTTLTFGNGREGARLPTGLENVTSVYRSGIGKAGNVKSAQVSLLQTKPLGVKSVVNPLAASGGADAETRDQGRANVPMALMALDRLISVRDYGDFARTFAGIGKADARRFSDGTQELVHVTIAGVDDIPIDTTSDLYAALVDALRTFGDSTVPLRVEARELVVLVLSANIRAETDYLWEPLSQAIRAALLDAFGFDRRRLGQPVFLSEIQAVIQRVKGVAYVDVDSFGGISEVFRDPDGTRRLRTLEEVTSAAQAAAAALEPRVDAALAGADALGVWPAQLAIFTSSVPDTLILNPIE